MPRRGVVVGEHQRRIVGPAIRDGLRVQRDPGAGQGARGDDENLGVVRRCRLGSSVPHNAMPRRTMTASVGA